MESLSLIDAVVPDVIEKRKFLLKQQNTSTSTGITTNNSVFFNSLPTTTSNNFSHHRNISTTTSFDQLMNNGNSYGILDSNVSLHNSLDNSHASYKNDTSNTATTLTHQSHNSFHSSVNAIKQTCVNSTAMSVSALNQSTANPVLSTTCSVALVTTISPVITNPTSVHGINKLAVSQVSHIPQSILMSSIQTNGESHGSISKLNFLL